MPRILLVDLLSDFQDFIINNCINTGIEVYVPNSLENVLPLIEKREVSHVIVNIDPRFNEQVKLLDEIQKKGNSHKVYIIVQTRKKDKETINTLSKISIVGILPSGDEHSVNFARIKKIIAQTDTYPNRRRFFRIKPNSSDNFSINFPIPNYSAVIDAQILDISIGGVAFKLNKPEESSLLREGDILDKTQINLNGRRTLAQIKIVKRGVITAAQFVNLKDQDTFSSFMRHFIFQRLQEDSGGVSLLGG